MLAPLAFLCLRWCNVDMRQLEIVGRDFAYGGCWLHARSVPPPLAVARENASAFSSRGQGAWHGR
jgi:hypothetical protein